MAFVVWDRQQGSDKSHIGTGPTVLFDHQFFELIEFRIGCCNTTELERSFEIIDTWIEGTIDMLGGALEAQCGYAFCFEPLTQGAHDPALADAGLAR